jgi:alpha-ketoglutarate-dependent 2,4-dichlorophenoxyacetate dioxygenase
MAITVCPVTQGFAAEIGDVDLSKPIAADDVAAIKDAFTAYAVLIFPEQRLSQDQHLDFARLFGPLETTIAVFRKDQKLRLPPELSDVSNIAPDNEVWGKDARYRLFQLGNRLWHTDSSFKRLPARASLLYARSIAPVGGHTEFADERAAYDALPEAMKRRLDGLIAEHSIWHSRGKLGGYVPTEEERRLRPPARHPLVRRHPGSGRHALYIASHASHIIGMPVDEGQALLAELIAFATQPRFVYVHKWRLGELVIWDNRCTMHRATPFPATGHVRDMRRTTVIDTAAEAPAVA